MATPKPETLNESFAIPGRLTFITGPGGLPVAMITHRHAQATVSLLGGQVTSYRPRGHDDLLWVSGQSRFEPGKAIRGGIPICWPWFADHPTDPTKPAHGIVRGSMWDVAQTRTTQDDQTQVRLEITDSEATRAIWPHPFHLTATITVGQDLTVELVGVNRGDQVAVCGGALHSYFSVEEVGRVAVRGLEGCTYIDKTDSLKRKTQEGPVKITGPTDWVFLDTEADCVIEDPSKGRRIRVSNQRAGPRWFGTLGPPRPRA